MEKSVNLEKVSELKVNGVPSEPLQNSADVAPKKTGGLWAGFRGRRWADITDEDSSMSFNKSKVCTKTYIQQLCAFCPLNALALLPFDPLF